jgi:hypothetical protein
VIELIAHDSRDIFKETMDNLRAKERLFRLKCSKGVQSCLVDPEELKFRDDPANMMTPRHVMSQSELVWAQREYRKRLNHKDEPMHSVFIKKLPLDKVSEQAQSLALTLEQKPQRPLERKVGRFGSCPVVGLPQLYTSPVKLATVHDFRITKWKTGDYRDQPTM